MSTEKKMYSFMPKVPSLMREESKKSNEDYEPKVVSFGPYHHGKEKLKFVEVFKPTAVEMFIEGNDRVQEGDYIDAILLEIDGVKSCYFKEYTTKYTNEELALMMLRDGCVILNYIGQGEGSNMIDAVSGYLGNAVYASIRRDMYLLENQIPLQILVTLKCLRNPNTSRQDFIKEIENYFFSMFFVVKKGRIEADLSDAHHLLEIFRRVIVRDEDSDGKDNSSYNVNSMLSSCLEKGFCKDDKKEDTPGRYVFRSVMDLKSKGIDLRASKINSLMGIRFSPTELGLSGELKLPHMYVDMYSKVFFKNVIAYELAPHRRQVDKKVTTYVSFMKLLVVTAEDVKELRENRIMVNSLKSEDDVVQLYKDLNTYEEEDPSYYKDVKLRIEKHYNSRIKMWMANFRTTYFSNPWTIIALAGSLFLLCLDIVQTYYAVNPSNSGGGDANQSSSPRGS